MFEIGKQYKILVLKEVKENYRDVSLYTATIIAEGKNFVKIDDRDKIGVLINKRDMIEAKDFELKEEEEKK